MKEFRVRYDIGTVKYSVFHHDGIQTHKDGSPFFDLKICKNKKQLKSHVKDLLSKGYKETQ